LAGPQIPVGPPIRVWDSGFVRLCARPSTRSHSRFGTLPDRVALLFWRLQRIARYEREAIVSRVILALGGSQERLLPDQPSLDKVIRYEAHLHRQLLQTMHELEALQARRQGRQTPLARVDVQGLADQ
jgi:hypothetical protein